MAAASVKENDQILSDAVARNAGAVLSLPSAGMVHNYKTRFLGSDEQGLWVEVPPSADLLLEELRAGAKPLAISFHANHRRLSFLTTVVKIDTVYRVNATVTANAVQIAHPQEVKGTQRRAAYRVHVPTESELMIKVWQIPNHVHVSDRPPASQEVKLLVRDISIGGLGVVLEDPGPNKHKLTSDQRLRIEIRYKEIEFVLDGRLRNIARADGSTASTGIIFKKLEGDLEGRQNLASLTRIVGELSRDEVRRVRRESAA